MEPLEHANNQELLSTLAGSSAAETLMKQYGGLTSLAQASFDELQLVKGIGKSKAAAIKSAFLLAQRLTRWPFQAVPSRAFCNVASGRNNCSGLSGRAMKPNRS
jgi:DNA repair protein RadC